MNRDRIAAALLAALVSSACGGGSGNGGGSSSGGTSSGGGTGGSVCEDNASVAVGEYTAVDNVWAGMGITHSGCATIAPGMGSTVNASWSWSWPATGDIAAYLEVVFGQKPWDATSTTTRLPRKLSQLQSVVGHVNWTEQNISSTTKGYLNFDVWLVKSLTRPSGSDHLPIATLLSVVLKPYGGATWGYKVRTGVHLDFVPAPGTTPAGCTFDVFYDSNDSSYPSVAYFPSAGCGVVLSSDVPVDFDVLPFVREYQAHEGSVPVVNKPVGYGQVTDDTYFPSLEFGMHVGTRSGQTSIQDYKVTVTEK